ncbi:MAG: hypothetical protein DRQ40_04465 [Gammaproteobacteria bacterium]|nr:MAG: hypothetical protein DRQ40_04465 [Gammaproteobacteria bacterium]
MAVDIVSREAQDRGLPDEPRPGDRFRYRYVFVHEELTSTYWKIDRELLFDAGLNVEYAWVDTAKPFRSRMYRFSSQDLTRLPGIMYDCKVRSFDEQDLVYLYGPSSEEKDGSVTLSSPYWHFLPAPEKA